jgi:hypothetical protein
LHDESGQEAQLKENGEVDLVIEADPDAVEKR